MQSNFINPSPDEELQSLYSHYMKSYTETKEAYLKDHLSKKLKQPQRRIYALKAIESKIKQYQPDFLKDDNLFNRMNRDTFSKRYQEWKGSPLSGAEKSVINGLFRFSA
jgi:hypothetical protein